MEPDTDLEIRASPWTHPGNAALCVTLALLTAFAALTLLGRGELIGLAFALIPPWMGWGAWRWLRRWQSDQPALGVTDEGVVDGIGPGEPVVIPWSEIVSVDGDGATLSVTLVNDARVKPPLSRRMLTWLTRSPSGTYLIPTRGLQMPPYAIAAHARERHEERLLGEVREDRSMLGGVPGESPSPTAGEEGEG